MQHGFRYSRSATYSCGTDACSRRAFDVKQHVENVSFDLENAYDEALRHGIVHLAYTQLEVIFPCSSSPCRIVILQGQRGYSLFPQKTVPQGGVLSVGMFGLAVNDIKPAVCSGVPSVDNFFLSYISPNLHVPE